MQEHPVRLALVGCGRIARMFHLPILTSLPDAVLVALADPDPDARRLARSLAPGAFEVSSIDEVLGHVDLDAVVVCTPTHRHAEDAVAAFEAGCAVYIEKPLAGDSGDAERIRSAWQHSGCLGVTGFNFRFHSQVRDARRLVRDGDLGRVSAVRTVFSSSPRDLPDWKLTRRTGGGALLDLASHHVDLVRAVLAEEITDVVATIVSVAHEQDTVQLQLRTTSGIPVQITATHAAAQSDRVEVLGDRATARLDRMARRRMRVDLVQAPETPLQRLGAAMQAIGEGARTAVDGLRPPVERSFSRALEAFIADVRGSRGSEHAGIQRCSGASIEDGYRVTKVLAAAERSLATGTSTAV